MQFTVSIEGDATIRLTAMAAAAPQLLTVAMHTVAEGVGALLVPQIEAATPVGVSPDHLRDSTVADVVDVPEGAVVQLRQTKRVGAKQWVLAPLIIQGHRIVTRSGVDTGRVTAPRDYVEPVITGARPEIDAAAAAGAHAAALTILRFGQ